MLKLRERGAPKPILDVPTRWGSTYDMIERLLVLKPIILDFGTFNEDIELLEEEWLAIEKVYNGLLRTNVNLWSQKSKGVLNMTKKTYYSYLS